MNLSAFSPTRQNKKVTTTLLPGLNHLLQHCHTCAMNEYATLPEAIAPEALAQLTDWIKAL